ncbi:hypothetical protein SeLEV6574_g07792 [Synchytrium endobioticum]|nr:hypothetical protein SeLEV6574_g07792 [Synchytrium endobioticum]
MIPAASESKPVPYEDRLHLEKRNIAVVPSVDVLVPPSACPLASFGDIILMLALVYCGAIRGTSRRALQLYGHPSSRLRKRQGGIGTLGILSAIILSGVGAAFLACLIVAKYRAKNVVDVNEIYGSTPYSRQLPATLPQTMKAGFGGMPPPERSSPIRGNDFDLGGMSPFEPNRPVHVNVPDVAGMPPLESGSPLHENDSDLEGMPLLEPDSPVYANDFDLGGMSPFEPNRPVHVNVPDVAGMPPLESGSPLHENDSDLEGMPPLEPDSPIRYEAIPGYGAPISTLGVEDSDLSRAPPYSAIDGSSSFGDSPYLQQPGEHFWSTHVQPVEPDYDQPRYPGGDLSAAYEAYQRYDNPMLNWMAQR